MKKSKFKGIQLPAIKPLIADIFFIFIFIQNKEREGRGGDAMAVVAGVFVPLLNFTTLIASFMLFKRYR